MGHSISFYKCALEKTTGVHHDIFKLKGVVHFKKKMLIIYSPHVIQDLHVILSSVEKKLRFLINILGFSPYNGLQWGPNERFTALNDTRR